MECFALDQGPGCSSCFFIVSVNSTEWQNVISYQYCARNASIDLEILSVTSRVSRSDSRVVTLSVSLPASNEENLSIVIAFFYK